MPTRHRLSQVPDPLGSPPRLRRRHRTHTRHPGPHHGQRRRPDRRLRGRARGRSPVHHRRRPDLPPRRQYRATTSSSPSPAGSHPDGSRSSADTWYQRMVILSPDGTPASEVRRQGWRLGPGEVIAPYAVFALGRDSRPTCPTVASPASRSSSASPSRASPSLPREARSWRRSVAKGELLLWNRTPTVPGWRGTGRVSSPPDAVFVLGRDSVPSTRPTVASLASRSLSAIRSRAVADPRAPYGVVGARIHLGERGRTFPELDLASTSNTVEQAVRRP